MALSQTKSAIASRKYRKNHKNDPIFNLRRNMYNHFCRLAGIWSKQKQTKHTGFPVGRPRKGEIRPATPGASRQKEYREKYRNSQKYKDVQAMYQQFWRLSNPDRSNEIKRTSVTRQITWKLAEGKFSK